MVSELKTFLFHCDACNKAVQVVEIYEKLPDGWAAIKKKTSANNDWHYCPECQDIPGRTLSASLHEERA